MDKLYVLYKKNKNGAHIPIGYAYGDEWVEQALLMDDVRYDTPEEAKAAWERWKEKNAEYIPKEVAIENAIDQMRNSNSEKAMRERILNLEAADVRPVVRGKNIGTDYDPVDQFVCSECGIELQGWVRVEHDVDTWEVTYHEYRLNFCPNCGADMREES